MRTIMCLSFSNPELKDTAEKSVPAQAPGLQHQTCSADQASFPTCSRQLEMSIFRKHTSLSRSPPLPNEESSSQAMRTRALQDA